MSALVSAPISAYLVHGRKGGGSAEVIRYLNDTGASMMQSATLQGFLSDPVDKLLSFLVVWLVLLVLPSWLKGRFALTEVALGRLRFNSRCGVAAVLSALAAAFELVLPAGLQHRRLLGLLPRGHPQRLERRTGTGPAGDGGSRGRPDRIPDGS